IWHGGRTGPAGVSGAAIPARGALRPSGPDTSCCGLRPNQHRRGMRSTIDEGLRPLSRDRLWLGIGSALPPRTGEPSRHDAGLGVHPSRRRVWRAPASHGKARDLAGNALRSLKPGAWSLKPEACTLEAAMPSPTAAIVVIGDGILSG